jgi:hypothetical protein
MRHYDVLSFDHQTTRPSFPGKCSEPRPRGGFRKVASLATPPGTGAESVFKTFREDSTN